MNLLDSLLDAIVRLNGDALVIHVGEKPYVVTTSEASSEFRGPLAWGQVELSTRVLSLDAVTSMLGHILPAEQQHALDEYGATEFEVTSTAYTGERFTIVAARGGEDIWVEIRRRVELPDSGEAAPAAADAVTPAEVSVRQDVPGDSGLHENPGVPESVPVHAAAENGSLLSASVSADAGLPDAEPPSDSRPLDGGEEMEDGIEGLFPELSEPAEIDMSFMEALLPDHEPAGDGWPEEVMTETELTELLRAPAVEPPSPAAGGQEPAGWPAAAELPLVIGDENDEITHEIPMDLSHAADSSETDRLMELVSAALLKDQDTASRSAASAPSFDTLPDRSPTTEQPRLHALGREPGAGGPVPVVTSGDGPYGSAAGPDHAAADAGDRGDQVVIDAIALPGEAYASQGRSRSPGQGAFEGRAVLEEGAVHIDTSPESEEEPPQADAGSRAVVVPLAWPSRPEEPADPRTGGSAVLQRLLHLAAARGAGAAYFVAQAPPLVRVDGEFSPLEAEPVLTAGFIERLVADLQPEPRDGSGAASQEWLVEVPEIGRVRCIPFTDHRGPGLICRMVPPHAITAEQLGLPGEVQALCTEADGLVLVGGSRRSGRSTLLTCFVDQINRSRSDHVITIEPEIGFVHGNHRGFISQREVRGDGEALASAVRAAVREEPDVLVIEELRTPEVVWLALEAAEAGCLVFGTVPSVSATAIVDRVIEMFPAERREKARVSLAGALRGIVSQVLLRRLKGGRVAAREILLNTPAVSALILEGRTAQLPAALEDGRRSGMLPFAESLAALVRGGTVHLAHACRSAPSREHLLAVLRRDGIDVAPAERLA